MRPDKGSEVCRTGRLKMVIYRKGEVCRTGRLKMAIYRKEVCEAER